MRLYRICRAPYIALDGDGPRLYGGRWNRAGRPVVYTASTLALAALEYLVHVDPDDVPDDLIALTIELPDSLAREVVAPPTLPPGWEHVPEHPSCQDVGDRWLTLAATVALEVPSAPIPEERNLLLNPRHPDAKRIVVAIQRPFVFDPRLFG